MQSKDTTNSSALEDVPDLPAGRLLGIDPGTKRCGIAVTDELRFTARPLALIERRSWKKLLLDIQDLVAEFAPVALVIGLPLATDGSESEMSAEAREMARKFGLSLSIPVFLQDERVTSYAAKGRLWSQGRTLEQSRRSVDSEAAAIILEDFMQRIGSPRR